jgi:hypothetical protein
MCAAIICALLPLLLLLLLLPGTLTLLPAWAPLSPKQQSAVAARAQQVRGAN